MYNPFKTGRYYKFFLESDHSSIKITTSDLKGCVLSGNSLKFPLGFRVLSVVTDCSTVANGNANTFGTRKVYGDGCQAVELPNASNFDYMTLYVFGYKR